MMEYQHPGLPVTEDCWLQRKSADSTVMDRKKAVVSYKPTPASSATTNRLQRITEPVTEDCFTYSWLGPGTGQVHMTG